MKKPFVSVIIPTLNDSDRLRKCLDSVYLQTYPVGSYEVIVVDNASTENIYSVCQQFPNVRYFHEPKRGSYAARNRGALKAKGEILAFTDSNCIPEPDWIEGGVNGLMASPEIGIVAGHIEFFFLRALPNPIEYLDSIMHLNQELHASNGYAATANVFTWQRTFIQVGPFREDLLNLGDLEWGKRVSATGLQVVYSEDACIWYPARSTMDSLLLKVRSQARSKPKIKSWSYSLFLLHILPAGIKFYRTLLSDENLATARTKLEYTLALHVVKYAIAWEMLKSLVTPQLPKPRA